MPAPAIQAIVAPATGTGCDSRHNPSQAIPPVTTSRMIALASAARIELDRSPYVKRPLGCRRLSIAAPQDNPSASTSPRLCPASASSASDPDSAPKTASAAT